MMPGLTEKTARRIIDANGEQQVFDERQVMLRSQAYKLGFFIGILVAIVIYLAESLFGFTMDPYPRMIFHTVLPMSSAIMYAVQMDAYEPSSKKQTRVMHALIVLAGVVVFVAAGIEKMALDPQSLDQAISMRAFAEAITGMCISSIGVMLLRKSYQRAREELADKLALAEEMKELGLDKKA
jgi:hypothetical protein